MNQTTAALGVLLVVLVIAAIASRRVAIAASLLAFAVYNFFFLPPVHTFAIAKGDDVVALVALLGVSLIGSYLSQQARRRAGEALAAARERDAAEAARRSAEVKSALVASLSHDLKTPLTALTIATSNLAAPGLADGERAEQMEIVRTELARLRRLFDHVVDMASLETQAINAEPEWVAPGDIIEAARRDASTALEGHPVAMTGDLEHPLVHVDPRLTTAALAHILENAATYAPAGSPIEITVSVRDNRLAIAVRDHGPGLQPSEIPHVFERSYRGALAGASPFGSGMGLAISRGLLALEGGTASASNHPDGGAVFHIDVPTATRPLGEDVP